MMKKPMSHDSVGEWLRRAYTVLDGTTKWSPADNMKCLCPISTSRDLG